MSRKALTPISVVILLVAAYFGVNTDGMLDTNNTNADTSVQLQQAFKSRTSDLQIQGEGTVAKVLRDDLKGSRHQRFILETRLGQSLMVAHNIDLAPRVANIKEGDRVEFYGEYEWNEKGGVIHWTHHDPRGNHPDGWLKHKGNTYE